MNRASTEDHEQVALVQDLHDDVSRIGNTM
jgi:hypothetical protein